MENTIEEIWVDVIGYDGLYKCSNLGNVMSYRKGSGRYGTGATIREVGRLLKPQTASKAGYQIVRLYDLDGNYSQKSVHRIVWESFNDKIPVVDENGEFIDLDHINSKPWDNRLENLQLLSHSENIAKSRVLSKPLIQFDLDGEKIAEFDKLQDTKKYGYDPREVSKVCRGIKKSYKRSVWVFKEEEK